MSPIRPAEALASLAGVQDRLALLSVHAHPDDEASKGAATVAKYHAEASTRCSCAAPAVRRATSRTLRFASLEVRSRLSPDAEKALADRAAAARAGSSAALIGFDEIAMLGYRDSGMPRTPSNEHPESFHQADIDEATWAPRRGHPQHPAAGRPHLRRRPARLPAHPDHLRVHDISVLAFERAGDPDWYPDLGTPFQPSKLYYARWSFERLLAVHKALITKNGSSPFEEAWFDRPNTDERITTRIDIADFQWARRRLAAHATQIDPAEAWWFGLDDDELNEVWPWEEWVLARSLVGPIPAHRTEVTSSRGSATPVRQRAE